MLLGPRQVGKTTLALDIAAQRPSVYLDLDLEREADRRILSETDLYLDEQAGRLVILGTLDMIADLVLIAITCWLTGWTAWWKIVLVSAAIFVLLPHYGAMVLLIAIGGGIFLEIIPIP